MKLVTIKQFVVNVYSSVYLDQALWELEAVTLVALSKSAIRCWRSAALCCWACTSISALGMATSRSASTFSAFTAAAAAAATRSRAASRAYSRKPAWLSHAVTAPHTRFDSSI